MFEYYFDAAEPADSQLRTLTFIGRSINKNNVVYFLISPASSDAAEIQRGAGRTATLSVAFDDSRSDLEVEPKSLPVDKLSQVNDVILQHLMADPVLSPLVAALMRRGQAADPAGAHIDFAHWSNNALVLNGWLRNIPLSDVFFVSDGASVLVPGEEAIAHDRPDVADFLHSQGVATSRTSHGFSVVLPAPRPTTALTIVAPVEGELRVVYADEISASGARDGVPPLLLQSRREAEPPSVKKIARLLRPFVATSRVDAGHDVLLGCERASRGDPIALSIIVPFYKEWRFVFPVLKMIARAPEAWEWVLVCDDPGILATIRRHVVAEIAATRSRITLVAMRENAGYGPANNAGAAVAAGEVLLFMNSDIWMRDFAPVESGRALVAGGTPDLLGFVLRFEDCTIQHAGITLAPRPEFDSLLFADHPGKGLPRTSPPGADPCTPVMAVTGALAMIRRDRFAEIGGFSSAYIGGDFEDVDLCLRVRRLGGVVALHDCDSLFHLERQSIRLDAESSLGFARTLVNCVHFNETWPSAEVMAESRQTPIPFGGNGAHA